MHNLLYEAVSREGEFQDLYENIAAAASIGLKKFKKYYNLIDGLDAYYIALILDPQFKTLLLERELGETTALMIIKYIKELLYEQYPASAEEQSLPSEDHPVMGKSIEARVLQKLQPRKIQISDIDRYFEDGIVMIDESLTKEKHWLLS